MGVSNVKKKILLLADAEQFLPEEDRRMSTALKKEVNQYINAGVRFTMYTKRTPATLMECLDGIEWKLPVVVMDGAGLYDMKQNEFLLSYQMSPAQARVIQEFLTAENCGNYFINVMEDNAMTIYYQKLSNPAEQDIYQTMNHSCYRTYRRDDCPASSAVVYFMLIDEDAVIENLYEKLMRQDFIKDCKVMKYSSTDYKGYSYIKIYHKDASVENMVDNFLAMYNLEDSIVMSSLQ